MLGSWGNYGRFLTNSLRIAQDFLTLISLSLSAGRNGRFVEFAALRNARTSLTHRSTGHGSHRLSNNWFPRLRLTRFRPRSMDARHEVQGENSSQCWQQRGRDGRAE